MVELYVGSSVREFSQDVLEVLKKGWNGVFLLLKELGVGEIASVESIEITLLDDTEMGRIHGEFLDDPTPTDVITFDHGELLIGVETAIRQASRHDSSMNREIALYGIHGMLHLAGFDDRCEEDAQKMAKRQFALLNDWFPAL